MKGATPKRVMIVQQTDERSRENCDGDDERHVEVERDAEGLKCDAVLDHTARDHARETHDSTNGEVDAARDDDVGHADGKDAVECDVLGEQQHGVRREEVRRRKAEEDDEHGEHDERAPLEKRHRQGVVVIDTIEAHDSPTLFFHNIKMLCPSHAPGRKRGRACPASLLRARIVPF